MTLITQNLCNSVCGPKTFTLQSIINCCAGHSPGWGGICLLFCGVVTDDGHASVADEPEVKIEGFDGNWYLNRQNVQLTCRADANPPVTIYQWKL